jgi:hypothetical protein
MNASAQFALHAVDRASSFRSRFSTSRLITLPWWQSCFMLNRFRLSWCFIVYFGMAAGVRAAPIPVTTLQITAGHVGFDHQSDDRSMKARTTWPCSWC